MAAKLSNSLYILSIIWCMTYLLSLSAFEMEHHLHLIHLTPQRQMLSTQLGMQILAHFHLEVKWGVYNSHNMKNYNITTNIAEMISKMLKLGLNKPILTNIFLGILNTILEYF